MNILLLLLSRPVSLALLFLSTTQQAEAAVDASSGTVFKMFYDLNVPYAADEAQLTNTLNFLAEGK